MSPSPFGELKFDGIVGMGLLPLVVHRQFSFFDVLVQTGRVKEPYFGFYLVEEDHGDSELALGGTNPKYLLNPDEPMMWSKLYEPEMGHWQILIKGLYIGDRRINVCNDGEVCKGIVDSGTSHLGIPAAAFDELNPILEVGAGDLMDCRLAKTEPITIETESYNLTIHPHNYMRRLPIRNDVSIGTSSSLSHENPDKEAVRPGTELPNTTEEVLNTTVVPRYCSARLLPIRIGPPLGPNLFMLGEPLLKEYYTVFHWSWPGVGFAPNINKHSLPDAGTDGNGLLPKDVDVYLMQQKMTVVDEEGDEVAMVQTVVVVKKRTHAKRFEL